MEITVLQHSIVQIMTKIILLSGTYRVPTALNKRGVVSSCILTWQKFSNPLLPPIIDSFLIA